MLGRRVRCFSGFTYDSGCIDNSQRIASSFLLWFSVPYSLTAHELVFGLASNRDRPFYCLDAFTVSQTPLTRLSHRLVLYSCTWPESWLVAAELRMAPSTPTTLNCLRRFDRSSLLWSSCFTTLSVAVAQPVVDTLLTTVISGNRALICHTHAITCSDLMIPLQSFRGSTSRFYRVDGGILKCPVEVWKESRAYEKLTDEIANSFAVERQILDMLGNHPRIVKSIPQSPVRISSIVLTLL